jgi:hypothetical protein
MNKLKFPILIILLILAAAFVAPRLQTVEAAPLAQEVPPNDNFADAQLIIEMPFSASVDISLATAEENDPTWCVEEWANQTVWYTFTPTTNGRLTMMSSGADFRTFSAVFRLDEYGNLGIIGCEPGNLSPTSLNLQTGETYYIQTGTWYPNSQGILSLQVSWQPSPPNDNFADALIVAGMPFVDSVENAAATTEPGETASMCEPGAVYNTVWYAFTPTVGGQLTGDFASSFNGILSVYTGSSLTELSELTCVYSDPTFQVAVTPGTTYYLRLSSRFEGDNGFAYINLYFTLPPANDNFADAKIVDTMPYQDTVYTHAATGEPGEPAACSDYGALRTIWYAYTPSEKGMLSGNASGEIYSFLAVYTGSAVDNLSALTCTNYAGAFQVAVNPETTYYIQLGSMVDWSYGNDTIYLSFDPAPSNDDFANAKIVDEMPYQDTVNNTYASGEPNEPSSCSDWGYGALRTVWYVYTPTEKGVLSANASGEVISFLAVYTGSAVDSLTPLTCTNWDGTIHVSVSPETTYYIQLGSLVDWSYGNDQINLSFTPAPPNDDFANAQVVDAMPYQETVYTLGATSEPGEQANCSDWGYGALRTIWYAYTPTEKGILSGDASGEIYSFLAVYTGSAVDSLTLLTCTNWDNSFQLSVTPGTTYYLQLGSMADYSYGNDSIHLYFAPAPANDDFANAMVIEGIPFSTTQNNTAASTEAGEPDPGCTWGGIGRTLWYAYTPSTSGSITFQKDGFYDSFIAVYTGSSLSSLTLQRCLAYWQNIFTLPLEAGVTYYIQLGSAYYDYYYGDLSLNLYTPPPPYANFVWYPGDPSKYDNIDFCTESYDPVGEALSLFWWDFGDGTQMETGEGCVSHNYPADGDYTVWHKVQTVDGRSAETTRVVYVRTHDVAITKFSVPQAVSVGQTRSIIVGVRNTTYPEDVTVELYKSTPYGFAWVGALNMEVPVRPANRTTDFKFSYTFANEDGLTGSITFQAIATLNNARDAAPGDNVAISLPTKVKGYVPGPIPYSATISDPANVTGAASTVGLLALGLVFGLVTVTRKEIGS